MSTLDIMNEIVGESGTPDGEGCLLAVSLVALAAGLLMLAGVGAVLWAIL